MKLLIVKFLHVLGTFSKLDMQWFFFTEGIAHCKGVSDVPFMLCDIVTWLDYFLIQGVVPALL